MEKKKTVIAVSLLLLLAFVAGEFLVLWEHGFSKRTVEYTAQTPAEESQENGPESVANLESQKPAQEGVNGPQEAQDAPGAVQNPRNSSEAGENVSIQPVLENPQKLPGKPVVSNTTAGKIVDELVSWGFEKSSGRTIKAIIVHTTYNALGGDPFDYSKVVQEWKDAGVSPHYAIDRGGTIHRLVSDQNIAWHAGVSKLPDDTTDVNGASIGVEVVNDQNSKFSDAEYAALNSLIATLKSKYPIKYVFGHDEIAPGRKTDPWGIDWDKVKK